MRYLKVPMVFEYSRIAENWSVWLDCKCAGDHLAESAIGYGDTKGAAFGDLQRTLGYEEVLDKPTPSLSEEEVKALEWALSEIHLHWLAAEEFSTEKGMYGEKAMHITNILNRFAGGKSAE